MATTVRDVATRALRLLGVIGAEPGAVPNAGQSQIALETLNDLRDQGGAERLQCYTVARATGTLTASQTSFTVGPSGNINITPRPVFIDSVSYVDNSVSPAVEISLGELMTDAEYDAVVQKTATSTRPVRAYYKPDFPTGTLVPVPISTGASLLWAVYYAVPIAEFTDINTTVTVPPGYRLFLITQLALAMAPIFQRDISPQLQRMATRAEAIVKRSNERKMLMQFPAESLIGSGPGSRWSILTGP